MARNIRRVENYTTPALVMGFVNLLWIFGAIWVFWGFPAMVLFACVLNIGISRLDQQNRPD